jgi:hypothetical protein
MTRITRINFFGISATAMAIVASSAIFVGCGQAPAVKAAAVTNPGPAINPMNLPSGQTLLASQSLTSLSAQQQAQVAGLIGNYTGSFQGTDANGNTVNQPYTLSLAKGTTPSVSGQTFLTVTFNAGPSMSFSALMAAGSPLAGTAGASSGYCFEFVSTVQTLLALDSNASNPATGAGTFMLNLQLCANSANQYDPVATLNTLPSGQTPINIVDVGDLYNATMGNQYNTGAQASYYDDAVVSFNSDFQKH